MMNTDEKALWISVIMQAAQDLTIKPSERGKAAIQEAAKNWFFKERFKEDFNEVCALAGLDPDATKEGAKRALERQVDGKRRHKVRRVSK